MKDKTEKKEMIAFLVKSKKANHLFGFIPYHWINELNIQLELILMVVCGFLDYIFSFSGVFMFIGMVIWWEHFRISEWRIDIMVDYKMRLEKEQELRYEFPDDFGPDFIIDQVTKTMMLNRAMKKYPRPRDLFYLKESSWSIFFTLCYFLFFELIFIFI